MVAKPAITIPIKAKESSKQEKTLETGASELQKKYDLEHLGDVTGKELYGDDHEGHSH